MKELLAEYQKFWSQFHYRDIKPPHTEKALLAYQEGYVMTRKDNKIVMPDFPYLVYQVPKPGFTESNFSIISIWDRPSQDMVAIGFQDRIIHIIEQIEEQIDADGLLLLLDNGATCLKRGSPWINLIPGDDKDPAITRAVLNVIIENYTM